jgi:hypothetical protein
METMRMSAEGERPDTITIMRARAGKWLAKLIRRDGTIEDYDSARNFDLHDRDIAVLTRCAGCSICCCRGEIVALFVVCRLIPRAP